MSGALEDAVTWRTAGVHEHVLHVSRVHDLRGLARRAITALCVEQSSLESIEQARLDPVSAEALGRYVRRFPTLRHRERALWDVARRRVRPALGGLAQLIEPQASWEMLVLPSAQRAILEDVAVHVRQRQHVYESWGFAERSARGLGITALFAGPSGTGKTMAAEVLARALRLDLVHVDLSLVVSKYIGETEKNLRRIFDAAEQGGAILLFDEADALFGRRSEVKDSHDRYANIEVSYLLQRMEAYRGLAILTTNLEASLDPAFLRRIRFVVRFPYEDKREEISIAQTDLMAVIRQIMEKLQLTTIRGSRERIELFVTASPQRPARQPQPLFRPADGQEPANLTTTSTLEWQQSDYEAFFSQLPGATAEGMAVGPQRWRDDLAEGQQQGVFAVVGATDAARRYVVVQPPQPGIGRLVRVGDEQVDPELEAEVNSRGIVRFLVAVASNQRPGGITAARFDELWGTNRSTPNREFVLSRFRSADPGQHEWLPSDTINTVIRSADPTSDEQTKRAAGLILWQHNHRTPTAKLVFDHPEWQTVNGELEPQGHTGAVYRAGRPRTVGQPAFHNELRGTLSLDKSIDDMAREMQDVVRNWIWDGEAPSSGVVTPEVTFRSPDGPEQTYAQRRPHQRGYKDDALGDIVTAKTRPTRG